MGKTSNDPNRYFRASIAMPNERKLILDARMKDLQLNTVGELVNMFVLCDGIVEVLRPFAKDFQTRRNIPKLVQSKARLIRQLRELSPEKLQDMLKLATLVENQEAV